MKQAVKCQLNGFSCLPSMCVDSLQPIPSRSVLSSSFDDAIFHLSTAKLAVPLKTESGEGKAANRNPRTPPHSTRRGCRSPQSAVRANGVPTVGRRFGSKFSDWRWAGGEGRSLGANRGTERATDLRRQNTQFIKYLIRFSVFTATRDDRRQIRAHVSL